MKPHTAILACIAAVVCAPSIAAEFQSVEAGTLPLRERLAAIKREALAMRGALVAERNDAEKAEIEKHLAALDAEEKQLTDELESARKQASSPYINYAVPPSAAK